MRLRHIEVFHAVYSTGSVTRAARLLNVSQPSVSKVLAHAEQQLGYRLFDRIKGKLVPTPEADQLYYHVKPVNDSLDRLRHVAENLKAAEIGRIRIAGTPAFGLELLPRAIASYRKQHPQISFSIETLHHDQIAAGLLESRFDVGLAFDPDDMPGISSETLGIGKFVVLTPASLEGNYGEIRSLNDLAGLPFIHLDKRGPLGQMLWAFIESSGITLNEVASVETYQVAKAMVAFGTGVTIVDEITARSGEVDNIVEWPLQLPLHYKIVALRLRRSPMSLLCQRFVDHLSNCVKQFLQPECK